MHAELSIVGFDLSYGLRTLVIQEKLPVRLFFDRGVRHVGFENFLKSDRAAAGPTTAVRRGKGLMKIDVQDVDAEIARPRNPHHRV